MSRTYRRQGVQPGARRARWGSPVPATPAPELELVLVAAAAAASPFGVSRPAANRAAAAWPTGWNERARRGGRAGRRRERPAAAPATARWPDHGQLRLFAAVIEDGG